MRFLRASVLLSAAALTLIIAGCERDRREEEITVETVTHPDRQALRLLVGTIKRDKVAWFFLIKGPKEEVGKHADEFKEFVRSAKFAEKVDDQGRKFEEPKCVEPAGWRKDPAPPPGGLRFAGYRIKAEPKELEVAVTRFPADDDWLLPNVQRWQKQVNLPPAATLKEAEAVAVQEKEITWVDLDGLGVHTVSKPPEPMALNAKKFQLPVQAKKPGGGAGGGGKVPFRYELPAGWENGDPGPVAAERYTKGQANLTLTPLGGGDLASNVNRWRKEVGLGPLDKEDLVRSVKLIKIAGIESYYVDIDNPNGPAEKNHTLGLIIPMQDGRSFWVVKMWGPSKLIAQQTESFETFVKSFKLDAR